MNTLRIMDEDFGHIKALFRKANMEQFIFLLAEKQPIHAGRNLFIVREIYFPDEANMKTHSSAFVEPDAEFQLRVYEQAIKKGYAIFDWHNHWFQEKPGFSGIDYQAALENGKFIATYLPGIDFGLAVFNGTVNAFSGMVYSQGQHDFLPLDSIEVIGSPMSLMFSDELPQPRQAKERYARHSLIPGFIQHMLPDLNVAIIGAGGTAGHIIQALACMGVGEGRGMIILADHDRVEASNLSRIPYAVERDIGRPKVELAADYISSKNPGINVTAIPKSIQDPEAQQMIKQAQLIFGCVDSEGARKIISQIAHEALIPYIDIGTEIIPQEKGYHAGGQVRVVMPRQGCLNCINGIDLSEAARDLVTEETAKDYKKAGYVAGTNQSPTPSVIHLNGVASYLAISQFIKLVFGEPIQGQKAVIYNQQEMSILKASFDRNESCPLCGDRLGEQAAKKAMGKLKKHIKPDVPFPVPRDEAQQPTTEEPITDLKG